MANIKAIADAIAKLSVKDAQELASIGEGLYNFEKQRKELVQQASFSSPKDYGMSLLNRKHKK